jgi:RNA polymerase sigma factor (sigma-70 family)
MVRNSALPLERFDEVLAWLDPDREVAATIYVQLREDLIKIFNWNRCADPEGLTDEAVDRVSKKIDHLRQTYQGNPKHYFHGVARNLIKENSKKVKAYASLDDADEPAIANSVKHESEDTAETRGECLHVCLQALSDENRELILAYYAKDKQAKIDYRHELAQRLGISVTTLRVRVYRIRGTLEECIVRCLKNMAQRK